MVDPKHPSNYNGMLRPGMRSQQSRARRWHACADWVEGVGLALRLLAGEDSRRDPADAVGFGDRVDLDDLACGDSEAYHDRGPPTYGDDHSGGAVHQRGVQADSRVRDSRCQALECLPGDSLCATEAHGGCGVPGACVHSEHDVGIEYGDEGVEIAFTRRQEEGIDYLALPREIGIWNR